MKTKMYAKGFVDVKFVTTAFVSPENGFAFWVSNYEWLLACVSYL
jgi:hypothetical protein